MPTMAKGWSKCRWYLSILLKLTTKLGAMEHAASAFPMIKVLQRRRGTNGMAGRFADPLLPALQGSEHWRPGGESSIWRLLRASIHGMAQP